MRKMMLDGKISDYSMYNNGNNWNSAASCQYPVDVSSSSGSNGFNESNNCNNKNQSSNDCNVNHYCQNPKFDHLTNQEPFRWNGSMAAMHQQAQPESNYFRNQWHFNSAATNSYHVNDTTISNIPTTQLSQNQHCLLIPHTHFHHPSISTGKLIWFDLDYSQDNYKTNNRNKIFGYSQIWT